MPTTRAAVRSYVELMPGQHHAVVESTSNWYWLSDLLRSTTVGLKLGHRHGASTSSLRSCSSRRAMAAAAMNRDAVGATQRTARHGFWVRAIVRPSLHQLSDVGTSGTHGIGDPVTSETPCHDTRAPASVFTPSLAQCTPARFVVP